jgi:hypothetical protein
MIKRLFLLSWLLTTIFNSKLLSQSQSIVDIKRSFYEAEANILFEDYKEALPLYIRLLRVYPANANFMYRVGQCYINTPGEKDKALLYLQNAVKNINPKYKEGKFREKGAPYDAFYYLANAYRINNMLDKALETYELFQKNLNTNVYDTAIVNLQIQSCLNAKRLMAEPLFVKEKNMGDLINESRSEYNPVVSEKEDMIVFSRSEAFLEALYYSSKTDGKWSGPVNMNELLKSDIPGVVDRDLFPTSLSADGKDLYLYSSGDYDGTIYTTRFDNGTWSPLVKLNDNINTKYWESHATISHDNKKLYFTSNRKGNVGGLDIFVSKKDTTGSWGPAVNLGSVINTPYNEEAPFLTKDDKTLFFSSKGHFNMGGSDIFYSSLLASGEWSVPLNVGVPINTTDDDLFFQPENDGYVGYISKDLPGGYGNQDIYRIEIFTDDHPRKFFVRGMVKVADLLSNIKDSVKISAMNIKDPNQVVVVYSNPKTGEYEFQLPQGNYQVTFEEVGVEKVVKNIDLAINTPSDSFVLPGTILPKTDFTADFSVESNKTISVAKGDTIMFPMKVEKNSLLTVEHWVGDSLISTEQFIMNDTIFNYKMVPTPGNNKVVFKLTDKFNNTTTTDVYITRQKDVPQELLIRPEYSRVIAKKQVAALAAMLKSRTSDKLLNIIKDIDIENKQFGKIDDLIAYIKEEAAKKNISPEEVDKTALKVAVMDNILTQAAVDYMAKHTTGELNKILTGLDIYKLNLQTWTDLQKYVYEQSGGRITPEELNKIAANVLYNIDPEIGVLRDKILAFSENSEIGSILREVIAAVDISNIKIKDKWLLAFYSESVKQGLTNNQVSEMLVLISTSPDTSVEQFLSDLIAHSEEPLTSALKALNLKKEKIKTPAELISFLLNNKDKEKYPEKLVSEAITNLITSTDIPAKNITAIKHSRLWVLWLVIGACIILFFIVLLGRKKKKQ